MKKIVSIILLCALALSLAACGGSSTDGSGSESGDTAALKDVTLVLDYVPNTNHTGLYVALDKGYFEEEGLNVTIEEPGDNSNSLTLVANGTGEFGLGYQEDLTYALTSDDPLPIKAIATVIQHNTSGFATYAPKNITSPKDFEGKVYAGWGGPGEEAVIRAVMEAVGADFSKLTMITSDGSGFSALAEDVDVMWFFEAWDCVKAEMAGFDLNYMELREFDSRLDYYTPVIITSDKMIEEDPETVQAFMNAVKKGYEYAIANPKESAGILHKYVPDYDLELLEKSQEILSPKYSEDSETWGLMKDEVWDNYTDFMYENGLITKKIAASECYTNEFIKE